MRIKFHVFLSKSYSKNESNLDNDVDSDDDDNDNSQVILNSFFDDDICGIHRSIYQICNSKMESIHHNENRQYEENMELLPSCHSSESTVVSRNIRVQDTYYDPYMQDYILVAIITHMVGYTFEMMNIHMTGKEL